MEKSKKKPTNENLDEGDDLGLGSLEDQKEKLMERFFEACKNGSVESIKKFLGNELLDPLELDSSGWSALQWAVVKNHPEKQEKKKKQNKILHTNYQNLMKLLKSL